MRRARSRRSIAPSRSCRFCPARRSAPATTTSATVPPACTPALDLATGKVIGSLHQRHRAIEFHKFLQTIDQQVPRHLDVQPVAAFSAQPRDRHGRSVAGTATVIATSGVQTLSRPPSIVTASSTATGGAAPQLPEQRVRQTRAEIVSERRMAPSPARAQSLARVAGGRRLRGASAESELQRA